MLSSLDEVRREQIGSWLACCMLCKQKLSKNGDLQKQEDEQSQETALHTFGGVVALSALSMLHHYGKGMSSFGYKYVVNKKISVSGPIT